MEELADRSILNMYMECAGKSEIPDSWHRWCCISMIAAIVSDRVYYKKFPWENLAPNMYIFLVGPSGVGKGAALGFAMQFYHRSVKLKYGSCTYKSLIDMMSEPSEEYPEPHKLFLVQAELANAVGSGQIADSFVKAMTDWYNPSNMDFNEDTRMHGERNFPPPCINWIAGTTTEWLGETIDVKDMMSGFFGRVAVAPGQYKYSDRVYDPTEHTPPNYDDLLGYIFQRMDELSHVEGEFTMSKEARELDEHWYVTRPEPTKMMAPFWRREHDLTLKLSMIISLCESTDLVIKRHHIIKAQHEVSEVRKAIPRVIAESNQTRGHEILGSLREAMKGMGDVWISKTNFMQRLNKIDRTILPTEVDFYIGALEEMGEIEVKKNGKQRRYRPVKGERTFDFGISLQDIIDSGIGHPNKPRT